MKDEARLTPAGIRSIAEQGLANEPVLRGRLGVKVVETLNHGARLAFILVDDDDQMLIEFAPLSLPVDGSMVYGESERVDAHVTVPVNIL